MDTVDFGSYGVRQHFGTQRQQGMERQVKGN